MGLRALYNGVIRFTNVRVPRERLLGQPGKGLKLALTTLNTGGSPCPLPVPAWPSRCTEWSTSWANRREQWGAPIARHEAISSKLAKMTAQSFAIEAMVLYICGLVDRDKNADIRIEAAMAKLWGTERGWEIVNDCMQIRGGRGYETADSLRARGEEAIPVERFLRDARINTIFEGSSEIMRLFLAREALDPHLRVGAAALNTTLSKKERLGAAMKAGVHYAKWYPLRWLPLPPKGLRAHDPLVAKELHAVASWGRKLARRLFHTMLRHGPALEKRQMILGRFVNIGTELFVLSLCLCPR